MKVQDYMRLPTAGVESADALKKTADELATMRAAMDESDKRNAHRYWISLAISVLTLLAAIAGVLIPLILPVSR